MRNALRVLLAVCCAMSFRAFGAEEPGRTSDGVAVDSERTIVSPAAPSDTKPEVSETTADTVGGASAEPMTPPAEYSGYGADELPSRE